MEAFFQSPGNGTREMLEFAKPNGGEGFADLLVEEEPTEANLAERHYFSNKGRIKLETSINVESIFLCRKKLNYKTMTSKQTKIF